MRDYTVKLVRDTIGDALGPLTLTFEDVESRDEHVERLRAKLMEEATEYLLKPGVGELADVLEAVRALAGIDQGVPWQVVVDLADDKRAARGGFTNGTLMVAHQR